MSDKQFDKFIKDKSNQRKFEYNDSYWTDMQQMLPAPPSTPLGLLKSWMSGWKLMAVVGTIAVSAGLVVYTQSGKITAEVSTLENPTQELAINEQASTTNAGNTVDLERIANNIQSEKGKQATASSESNTQNKTTILDLNQSKNSIIPKSNNSNSSKKANTNIGSQKSSTKEVNETNETKIPLQSDVNNLADSINNKVSINEPVVDNTSVVEPTTTSKKVLNQNSDNSINKTSIDTNNADTNTKPIAKNNVQENSKISVDETPATDKITTNADIKSTTRKIIIINELEGVDWLVEANTTAINANKTWIKPIKPRKSYDISVVAGMIVSQGLTNQELTTIENSYDPTLGLQGSLALSDRLKVNLGVLASRRGALNSSLESKQTTYGFGYRRATTTVAINQLYQVQVPLSLSYKLNYQNSLQIGLLYNYLLNTYSQISESVESSFSAITTQPTANSWGYATGFKTHDFGVTAGFIHHINERLDLGLNVRYGLLDITDNTQFQNSSIDKNLQLCIFSTYDLISR